jgi:hypothetical protein
MTAERFQALLRRASVLKSDYGAGYKTGLRKNFHGEEFGDAEELAALAARQDERARGYHDGLAGRDPAPLMGRPPLAADAPRSEKRPRTIRLDDERWARLRSLGTEWLESALDSAEGRED